MTDVVELELVRHDPTPARPDLSALPLLSDILRELDPDVVSVPMPQIAVTGGRFLAGAQTDGFLQLVLPPGFELAPLVHAADERVPDADRFGAEAVGRVVERYPG